MELRDYDVPKETKQEFEKLKENYPEVFSLNNQDIGRTQLVTMHVDTGDSPPICQNPYTLPLKHYSWVQQEIETLEQAGIIKKSRTDRLVIYGSNLCCRGNGYNIL